MSDMTTTSLRERLAAELYGEQYSKLTGIVLGTDEIVTSGLHAQFTDQAERLTQTMEVWLAERKLRIVPEDSTSQMFAKGNIVTNWGGDAESVYDAMLLAAPSNASQLHGEG